MSLLEKAKKTKTRRCDSHSLNERLDLALAYAQHEITSRQVSAAFDSTSHSSATTRLGNALMTAARQKLIRIVDERE